MAARPCRKPNPLSSIMEKEMRFTRWDQRSCSQTTLWVAQELALMHCAKAGDPGAALAELILSQDWAGIVSFRVDYASMSSEHARELRQALAFFQKRKDLVIPGVDREAVAREKFMASERLCRETNSIFRDRAAGLFQYRPRTERVLFHAARKIRQILGPRPRLDELKLRFGPGATTQVTRRMASARAKLGEVPACSTNLFPAAQAVMKMMPGYREVHGDTHPVVCHAGRVVFVPKSAKELRTVIIEPSLNTMCQAGIGDYMAGRLRASGVDIRDQTLNQRLAREGSLTGALATLDLSSASDTVATELVYDLLGGDWFSFLSMFRTGLVTLDGREIRLEKFSSMGNGFTFPLETLIFYALAYGCCVEGGDSRATVTAYGDDIIIESRFAELLADVLHDVGFIVNVEKSYWSGPFRESCGKDYFRGFDIRPVYLKDILTGADLFRLYNHYFRWYASDQMTFILDLIDPSIRIWGPDGYGDGHLLGEWVPVVKRKHLDRGFGGSVFDTFVQRGRVSTRPSLGDRVLPSYSIYLRSLQGADDLRAGFAGVKDVDTGPPPVTYNSKGDLEVAVPGAYGCRRISIYTFARIS